MNKGWYYIAAKNDLFLIKESDVNWKDVRKGLGLGAGLGVGVLGLGLLSNNLPNQAPSPAQQTTQVEQAPVATNKPQQPQVQQTEQTEQSQQTEQPQQSFVSDNELESFISHWEGGARSKAYKDSKGIWTIAIGFNLESPNASSILKQIGADKKSLIAGKTSLSKDQMSKLFKINLKTAINDAKIWIPNLESQPKEIQKICVDMSFNMGGPTLSQFQTTGKYIANKNYAAAASRLERTLWFGQVGKRSKNHVSLLKNLAKQQDQEKKDK